MNKLLNVAKYVLVVLGSLFLLILLLPVKDTSDAMGYEYRKIFIDSCMGDDPEMYQYCRCAFNYLDRNYTNEEIMRMSVNIDSEETDEALNDAAIYCLNK